MIIINKYFSIFIIMKEKKKILKNVENIKLMIHIYINLLKIKICIKNSIAQENSRNIFKILTYYLQYIQKQKKEIESIREWNRSVSNNVTSFQTPI